MNRNSINKVIIVGGGSAGWMSAAYLNFLSFQQNLDLDITLVESPDIATVGVGEATVPTIRDFFSGIGISEKDLLQRTHGSIKSAIKFVNWNKNDGSSYYHPFEAPLFSDGVEIAGHWVSEKLKQSDIESFAHATGILATLCDELKVPKQKDAGEYQGNTLYAYHLDAVLMAKYLREIAISRGVKRVEDTVLDVALNESGEIASIKTEKNGDLEADFFVDCTGFASVLIEKTLKEEFVSYEEELLCNSAVAIQTPYLNDSDGPDPFTTATAKDSGWMWEIGLTSRKGNGYVFSDKFSSFDSAEKEIRMHLGESAENIEAKRMKMRVGRRSKFWSKNCLSIGLSSGFVEPLESTGLQFIQVGLELFKEYYPSKSNYEKLQQQYNEVMVAKYEDVKDFIVAHYCLTDREDTDFWKYIKYDLRISDSLSNQLELWKHKLPTHSDLKEIGMFGAPNYMYILAGMDSLSSPDLSINLQSQRSQNILLQMKRFRKNALDVSLTHSKYLESISN